MTGAIIAAPAGQIEVRVNPFKHVGNIQVTVEGPCMDHSKFVGEDGIAAFGCCDVVHNYTVRVPENVVTEGGNTANQATSARPD